MIETIKGIIFCCSDNMTNYYFFKFRFLLVDFGLAQVCSSSSPLAKLGAFSTISSPSASSTIISATSTQKRKREDDKEKVIENEPAAKRQALQKRSVNIVMNSTVSFLQSSLNINKNVTSRGQEAVQLKENLVKESIVRKIEQSPFKSPVKMAAQAANVLKSPYKFTGLDLPPNHPKCKPIYFLN